MEVGRFSPSGHAHFSRCARILAVKAESDLNAENFSIIVVGDVLNNQERNHEHGHSGSNKKRDAGAADRSAVSGNRAHQHAAPMTNMARSLGDAVISVVLLMS